MRPRQAIIAFVAGIILLSLLGALAGTLMNLRLLRTSRGQQLLVGLAEERAALDERRTTTQLLGDPVLLGGPKCELSLPQRGRYAPLRRSRTGTRATKFLIVLTFHHQVGNALPSLVPIIHSLITFLGPTRFGVSIYEKGSREEGTKSQLAILALLLEKSGVGYTIISDLRSSEYLNEKTSRIHSNVHSQNLALKPLFTSTISRASFDQVLFFDQVVMCLGDVLELILQHELQESDLTCGMNFGTSSILLNLTKKIARGEEGQGVVFRDIWTARDMMGM